MTSKQFFKNILFIAVFFIIVFLAVLIWLRVYTNHGQKLSLPDFKEMEFEKAFELADNKSFKLIVNDSVHIIGKPGGIIIDQNPKSGSKVKENRKVYVTTTKFEPDRLKVENLPGLYGRDFARKQKELSFMDINSRIKEYIYDPGEPNHILEVYYKDQKIISSEGREDQVEIEKGATLDFVLSKRFGGEMSIPDIVCMDFESASFFIENLKLSLGDITEVGEVTDRELSFIVAQDPPFSEEGKIKIGDRISISISQIKPENCF